MISSATSIANQSSGLPAAPLVLVSHELCPYVQRAAIVLAEKGEPFERRVVDLAAKPSWFLAISPLGKTPVLLVNGSPIFESAVICEYLDEVILPRLLPTDALRRARHRGWMTFGSSVLDAIAGLYSAPNEMAMAARLDELRNRFEQVEAALAAAGGPYFDGHTFGLVDAVFGPVFRYFDVLDEWIGTDLWHELARTQAWRAALAARPSVRSAVESSYAASLRAFIARRNSAIGAKMAIHASPPR